jgi:hypothetical protein
MADPIAAAPGAVPTEAWPFARRFVAAYTSPRALFEQLAQRPSWFAPFVVLVVLVIAFVVGLYDPVMLPEQLAKVEEQGGNTAGVTAFFSGAGRIIIPAIAVVSTSAVIFVYALFVQLVGAFLLGGALRYKQSLSIVLHASMVGVLGFVLRVPLALIAKSSQVTVGPGMIFPAASAEGFGGHFLSAFLSAFDVFSLWQTALIALGVSVVARVPSGKANTGIWSLFFVGALVGALIAGVFGGMARH